ncbi:MAG TPA: transketolase C-terminal domain-containing protein [Candidatus Methylacidiphilales bacterium]|nr:transketolase C-terminal domain-containing protein [Candidatus Methylacidiphilales bacterium]
MRNAFADEIFKLAGADERVVMLSADIGNRLFDKYKASYPGRFYNCGVAEANTVSLAAGLASCGLRPVCYTITPFITARCFEQIKVDICYHEMPVLIVGTGSGLSYASLGATHHSLDDLALMRSLPGMRVLAPADAMELRSCLRAALASDKPVYMRIGKKGEPVVFAEPPPFAFGKWTALSKGDAVHLLSTGNMLPVALEVAGSLAEKNRSAGVFSCASVKPLDEEVLRRVFGGDALVATIEEHGRVGGFGAAVAEWLADQPERPRARLLRFGTDDYYLHDAGEQEHARETYGISAGRITESVLRALETKR